MVKVKNYKEDLLENSKTQKLEIIHPSKTKKKTKAGSSLMKYASSLNQF